MNPHKPIDSKNPPKKILRWIERFKKCLSAAPEGIWIFNAPYGFYIMALDKKGEPAVEGYGGGVSRKYMIDYLTPEIHSDGGDW